jgi:hypothetical protein
LEFDVPWSIAKMTSPVGVAGTCSSPVCRRKVFQVS